MEIVKRIYSFGFYDYENLNNLREIEEDFCEQFVCHFSQKKGISTEAPKLFFVLVECCLKSLDVIITDEQDLLALDYKIKVYFKISAKRLEENSEKLLRETKVNQILITQVYDSTKKILNELTSLPMRLEQKTMFLIDSYFCV